MNTEPSATIGVVETLFHEDRFALECALVSVSDLMTRRVVAVDVRSSLEEAARLFSNRRFRHILVLDGSHLAGVLSERDALRASLEEGDPRRPLVSAIMTRDPITVSPHASLSEAIHLLTSNQIDCLPVTGEGREIYGIITKSDLLQVSFVVQRWLETRAPRLHG
jgi:CBS domain-containing protein